MNAARAELCRREATRYAIESADIRAAWHRRRMPRAVRDVLDQTDQQADRWQRELAELLELET